jgi:hypothetical protein
LVALLFEDAAVVHPVPFDPIALGGAIRQETLPEAAADLWIKSIASLPLVGRSPGYIADQARLLGVSARMARSELHVVKPHHKVLELPGSGGQLAHHLVNAQRDLTLHENFTVACGSWQELTLAGVIALEMGAPHSDFAKRVRFDELRNSKHELRQRAFDFVIGLDPGKSALSAMNEQLAIWFPGAKVLLV